MQSRVLIQIFGHYLVYKYLFSVTDKMEMLTINYVTIKDTYF